MPHTEEKQYTFENIAQKLKGYRNLKRKSLQLEYEISNYIPCATGDDVIDSMTFNRKLGDGINLLHNGQTSDKTGNIAITYLKEADNLNIRHKNELAAELRLVEAEIYRIDYYVSILDEKNAIVLRKLYFEAKTFVETSTELEIGVTTVKNLRKVGIQKLVEMFNLISN